MRSATTRPVTSAARLAAVPVLSRALAAHNVHLDTEALCTIVDDVARVFDRTDHAETPAPVRRLRRFSPGWTPYDEARLAQDDQADEFAAWYEAQFGGDAA